MVVGRPSRGRHVFALYVNWLVSDRAHCVARLAAPTMSRIIAAERVGSTSVSNAKSDFPPLSDLPPLADELQQALDAQQIAATAEQVDLLDRYRRLLWAWNERMNLTRHTTLEKFVGRDIVDSHHFDLLLKQGDRILDVGTGGG